MFAFRKTHGTEFCSFFKLCFHVIFFLLCCVKSSELSRDELSHGKTPPEWRSPRCSSASSKCGSLLLKTLRCNGIFFRLLSCLFLFVSREERQCSPRFLQRISGSARCEFWRDPKEFFEGCDLGAARSSRSVEEGAKPDAGLWAVCFCGSQKHIWLFTFAQSSRISASENSLGKCKNFL